jgi:hypothetical protein
LKYREYTPGRYFPSNASVSSYYRDRLTDTTDIELRDIRINEHLPKDILTVPRATPGMMVTDRNASTTYRVNENWEPIGPQRPYRPLLMPSQPTTAGEVYFSQTVKESGRSNWLLIGSLTLVASVLVFRCIRKYRRLNKVSR